MGGLVLSYPNDFDTLADSVLSKLRGVFSIAGNSCVVRNISHEEKVTTQGMCCFSPLHNAMLSFCLDWICIGKMVDDQSL